MSRQIPPKLKCKTCKLDKPKLGQGQYKVKLNYQNRFQTRYRSPGKNRYLKWHERY